MTTEMHELKQDIEKYRKMMVELWEERKKTDSEVLKVAEYLDVLINRYQKRA